MPFYSCLISGNSGRTETRIVSASDEAEAVRSFAGSGFFLISIEQVPESGSGRRGGKVKKAVLEFTGMMELLLESGISLRDALELMASMNKGGGKPGGGIGGGDNPALLARRLLEQVQKGVSFAQAVQSSPDIFPSIYRGMIRVGDRVGSVERIFPRLSAYLRDRKKMRDRISGALAYPLLVLAVTVLGTIALAFIIIPQMEAIFSGFGGDAADRIQENISAIKILFAAGGAVLALSAALVIAWRTAAGREHRFAFAADRMLLRLPFAGKFMSSWETLNFSFAMETLASGGVSIEDAIEEASHVVSNSAYRRALLEVRDKLLKGVPLAESFAKHDEFPGYMSQWIAIGERSGRTDRVFSQIRSYFQDEVEQRTGKLLTLVEPAMIVVIGVFLLALITGVIVPLFTMYGSIL